VGDSHSATGEDPTGAGGATGAGDEVFPALVARDVAAAEEGYLTLFEEGLGRLSEVVDRAAGRERSWLSRLRAGLVAFLAFFEDEPRLGGVLVREAPVAEEALALRCRARVLGVLSGLLDDGAPQACGELTGSPELTSELMAAGVFASVRSRVLMGEGGSLVGLAPPLMAFIVAPYLGQAAARLELEGRPEPFEERGAGGRRLYVTRRTRLVLRAIEAAPRSSNREVAQAAGLVDEGQASKLLHRLAGRGLIENVGSGQAGGRSNAWVLTSRGEQALARFGERAREGRSV
jgi:hypothetical protein